MFIENNIYEQHIYLMVKVHKFLGLLWSIQDSKNWHKDVYLATLCFFLSLLSFSYLEKLSHIKTCFFLKSTLYRDLEMMFWCLF